MIEHTLERLSAFTTDPAGGNPAGVWIGTHLPTPDAMLRIAADVGYSETAFLTPADEPDHWVTRYYSPRIEVDFCGHATIAAAVAIGRRHGAGRHVFHTTIGDVPVDVKSSRPAITATLTSVEPQQQPLDIDLLTAVLHATRWTSDDLDPGLQPGVAFAGARHSVRELPRDAAWHVHPGQKVCPRRRPTGEPRATIGTPGRQVLTVRCRSRGRYPEDPALRSIRPQRQPDAVAIVSGQDELGAPEVGSVPDLGPRFPESLLAEPEAAGPTSVSLAVLWRRVGKCDGRSGDSDATGGRNVDVDVAGASHVDALGDDDFGGCRDESVVAEVAAERGGGGAGGWVFDDSADGKGVARVVGVVVLFPDGLDRGEPVCDITSAILSKS